MRVRAPDVRNQPTSLLVIDEEKRPKGMRRGGLFGWRDSFHVPLFFFVFSVLMYLYLSCAFPAYLKAVLLFKFNPFVQQIPTNREHVDTHFRTVAKLSAAAVQEQTVGPLKVEDLEFRVEQHGLQCLVYSHKARKVVPKAVGDVTWVTQMTTDRLKIFKEMLKRWNGPLSVGVLLSWYKSTCFTKVQILTPDGHSALQPKRSAGSQGNRKPARPRRLPHSWRLAGAVPCQYAAQRGAE